MSDYKNSDKILRGELEQLVRNKAYLESKKILSIKYRKEFLMQPKKSESREKERVKRRFGID